MRILVPLDGSVLAERALYQAAAVAEAVSGEVVLVRVDSTAPTASAGSAAMGREHYLQQAGRLLAQRGIRARIAVCHGKPAQAILDTVGYEQADLVVMATHAQSGVGAWLFGSVAEAVVRGSPVPVLLARAWGPEPTPPQLPPHSTVLVPLDGSAFAEQALPVAGRLASVLEGELVLLQAVWTPDSVFRAPLLSATWPPTAEMQDDDVPNGYLGPVQEQAREYLTRIANRLDPSLRVTRDIRVGQSAASAIIDGCREHTAVLVVMSTHGRTGLKRLAFGSVAAEVLRRGDTPLLLAHPLAAHSVPSKSQQRSTAMQTNDTQLRQAAQPQASMEDLSVALMPALVSDLVRPQASPFERLVDTVEAHIKAEDDTLADYRHLANMALDRTVSLLMSMVLQDEERHHQLLRRMATTLRDSLDWTKSPEALPIAHATPGHQTRDAIAIVRECIRHEREGARHMRELARGDLQDDAGLCSLLVETIAMDSDKHERIMRYVLQRLAAQEEEATAPRPLVLGRP